MRWGETLAFVALGLLLGSASAWGDGRSPGGGRGTGGGASLGGGLSAERGGRPPGGGFPAHRPPGLAGDHGRHRDHAHHGHHRHHRFPFAGRFFPFGYHPGYVTVETVSAPPPVVVYPPPSPAPPLVRTIHYATGLYQLYGDGVTTPFEWVWVPNPPPPPPEPPAAPPPPQPGPSASQAPPVPEPQAAPSTPSELWTWTDEQGTAHWTDRRDKIPEPYRAVARRRG